MFRSFWIGIVCVAVPPVGIGLAVWWLLRGPGEVPPEATESYHATYTPYDRVPNCRCALVEAEEPRRDWSKMGAYQDGL